MNGKRIRPLAGEVLIYMDASEEVSGGGIVIPEKHQERSQFGQVRRLGLWKQSRRGSLVPFEVKPGDRVLIRPAVGRWLHSERERLKLVPCEHIEAIVEK